jgi:hypothetical protein
MCLEYYPECAVSILLQRDAVLSAVPLSNPQ